MSFFLYVPIVVSPCLTCKAFFFFFFLIPPLLQQIFQSQGRAFYFSGPHKYLQLTFTWGHFCGFADDFLTDSLIENLFMWTGHLKLVTTNTFSTSTSRSHPIEKMTQTKISVTASIPLLQNSYTFDCHQSAVIN